MKDNPRDFVSVLFCFSVLYIQIQNKLERRSRSQLSSLFESFKSYPSYSAPNNVAY